MSLRAKVAVITGGGRGIGEAVALALAREGVRVVLAARTLAELRQVQAAIREMGSEAEVIATDVTRPDDVRRLTTAATGAFGPVDILVNAAGVYGPIGPSWEVDAEAWIQALHVNLVGTFLCCRAVVPEMIRRRQGKIVNFSGGGATAPLPNFSAYAASKAAVVRFTETLADEVRDFNIQVNAIAPGMANTRLQDAVLDAGERAGPLLERIRRLKETGEGGVPSQLTAELVLFLLSDRSAGLTGKLIAAPYDDWKTWTPEQIAEVNAGPWYTLRRIDLHTLRPLAEKLR